MVEEKHREQAPAPHLPDCREGELANEHIDFPAPWNNSKCFLQLSIGTSQQVWGMEGVGYSKFIFGG